MIVIDAIEKRVGGLPVLRGTSFTIESGQITVLLGGSGEGKSVLLRILTGALRPDAGAIRIEGTDLYSLDELGLIAWRRRFGMLFQGGALLHSMTVGENIGLPIRHHTDLDPDVIAIMVKMKLDLVGLRDFEHYRPDELSGGMVKRVALARAIALDPEVLFCDEPTTGLDPIVVGVINKLITDLNKKLGLTSLVVTHDIQSAFQLADRIVVLHGGRIVASGSPAEIKASNDPLVQQFINGLPEGPIPFQRSGRELVEDLLEEKRPGHRE